MTPGGMPDVTLSETRTTQATLKHWMGSAHFLTKTLKRVSTEMSLHVLAYNLKRLMRILGPVGVMTALRV